MGGTSPTDTPQNSGLPGLRQTARAGPRAGGGGVPGSGFAPYVVQLFPENNGIAFCACAGQETCSSANVRPNITVAAPHPFHRRIAPLPSPHTATPPSRRSSRQGPLSTTPRLERIAAVARRWPPTPDAIWPDWDTAAPPGSVAPLGTVCLPDTLDDSELLHRTEAVPNATLLDHLAVGKAEQHHSRHGHRLTRSGNAAEVAAVRPGKGKPNDHSLAFGDNVFNGVVCVRKGCGVGGVKLGSAAGSVQHPVRRVDSTVRCVDGTNQRRGLLIPEILNDLQRELLRVCSHAMSLPGRSAPVVRVGGRR